MKRVYVTLVETKTLYSPLLADNDYTYRLAFSPDGAYLYATTYLSNILVVFQRNSTSGALTIVKRYQDGVAGVDGLAGALGLTVSPDGAYLYVAGGMDRSITLFTRDPATGLLTYGESYKNGVGGVDGLTGVSSLHLSPGGAWLYATGWGYLEPQNPQAGEQSALTLFARNPQTGKLTFVEKHEDGVAGITSLRGAAGLQVSLDGKYVYVTSSFDDAVTVFSREAPVATPTATATSSPTPTNTEAPQIGTATPTVTATPITTATPTATATPVATTMRLYLPNIRK